jgi:di/tricarboxylate transporter
MEAQTAVVWVVLLGVVVLFARAHLAADAVALGGLLILVLGGILSPHQALQGLSSPAVIAIASLLVLGAALERSGVVRRVADGLYALAGKNARAVLLTATLVPGLLSGVINIIAAVTVFIPVLLRLALQTGTSPTRLLLPMACVAMAGANLTLIGAAHNLVVNDILRERTGQGFGFFDITPVGLMMVAMTTVYVLLASRWLLPTRDPDAVHEPVEQTRELIRRYEFSRRLWEVEVAEESAAAGTRLGDIDIAGDYGLSLIALVRADHGRPHFGPSTRLQEGDILLLGGRRERVEQLVAAVEGLELRGAPAHREDFSAGSAELVEVLVPPRSAVIDRKVGELDLRGEADLTAIALWREGRPLRTDVQEARLQAGDAILLYGEKRYTRGFEPEPDLLWLHAPVKESAPQRLRRLAPWTLLVFVAVILVAALGWLPVALAALAGALVVTAMGVLGGDQAYRRIDWRSVVLVAAMLPFATALDSSGVSHQVAGWMTGGLGSEGPRLVLAAVSLATLLLTQVLHNAAAAAITTPIALDAAQQLGANPKAFAVAVLVSASMTLLLPVGHPAPLLVRRPGAYRSGDYLRFGSGLALLTLLLVVFAVPWLWPLG